LRALAHSITAAATIAALPVAAIALALSPRWRAGLGSRLGAVPDAPARAAGGIWVHAASLGETRACAPLLRAFGARGESLHLTHTRADALAIDVDCDSSRSTRALAPLEHPWCLARALDAVAPRAIVLIETEIWPLGIRAASERGVRTGVVSAAISDRSFARYRAFVRAFRPTFGRLAFVGARSERDAERFAALGTRESAIRVTGDLKVSAGAAAPLARDLHAALAGRRVLVAGSTHQGEEAAIFAAFAALADAGVDALCVVAPRDVARAEGVCAQARAHGLRARLRSRQLASPLAAGEVVVLDTIGELASCYACALVAFVGGSLVPLGGHNLCEPASAGALVMHGPHADEARRSDPALAGEAGTVEVADARALREVLLEVMRDEPATRARAARLRAALAASPSVADRTLAFVDAQIGAQRPRGVRA